MNHPYPTTTSAPISEADIDTFLSELHEAPGVPCEAQHRVVYKFIPGVTSHGNECTIHATHRAYATNHWMPGWEKGKNVCDGFVDLARAMPTVIDWRFIPI